MCGGSLKQLMGKITLQNTGFHSTRKWQPIILYMCMCWVVVGVGVEFRSA